LGLEFNIKSLNAPGFIITVLIVSIAAKVVSGMLAGRLTGMRRNEALGLGVILNGRGVMGLVAASIAYDRGFIGEGLFSTLVLMSIVTTIAAPVLFRRWVLPKLSQPKTALPEPVK
jgi:Kef-type K+ transport system membrane component KefB